MPWKRNGGLKMYHGLKVLRTLIPALALVLTHSEPVRASQAPRGPQLDVLAESASPDIRYMARWIDRTADNQGMPFVIVDKKAARVFVFGSGGQLIGSAPTLLGLAPGDHSVPGIGERPLSKIAPSERTTPAGRFQSEPGRNLTGEDVVWVDYDAGLAIHRVRPGSAQERRQQRLASPQADDNRISLGCIVVAAPFYESVIAPVLGRQRGVVYVLPETRPVAELFGAQHQASLDTAP